MKLGRTTPILRIFDEAKARGFYVGFLGFRVDWEHRFGESFPLYMQVSRDGCVLHLSEHHGDSTPGSAARIETTGIEDLHREIEARHSTYMKPGLEEAEWGEQTRHVPEARPKPRGERVFGGQRRPATIRGILA